MQVILEQARDHITRLAPDLAIVNLGPLLSGIGLLNHPLAGIQ